jgi:hypothetical protein
MLASCLKELHSPEIRQVRARITLLAQVRCTFLVCSRREEENVVSVDRQS